MPPTAAPVGDLLFVQPKRKVAAVDSEAQAGPPSTPSPESKPRRELPPYLRVIK